MQMNQSELFLTHQQCVYNVYAALSTVEVCDYLYIILKIAGWTFVFLQGLIFV